MIEADSPAGVRRRIHLRSLSDVTPASRALAPRARSHSERPRALPAPSPSHPQAPAARAVRSARSSPDASRERLDAAPADPPPRRSALADPWRKMSELDLRTRAALDPWVKNAPRRAPADPPRDRDRAHSGEDLGRPGPDPDPKRDNGTFKRGKLERKPAVVCESCGNESCECWRPRTPRAARSLGARCTCSPRSPRPSPARLASLAPAPAARPPLRALSDDEGRPRRLYKSASQKIICSSMESDGVKKPVDPLLETTC